MNVVPRRLRFIASCLVSLAPLLAGARVARAQYGMGMPGGGGMPQAPMGQQQKEEGPAQQAPEEPGTPNELEPLSELDDQRSRRTQIFELNGYLRLRTDYLHGFNLGQGYTPNNWNLVTWDSSTNQLKTTPLAGRPPFPIPLSCPQPNGTDLAGSDAGCGDKDLSAANLRFRLEPTLNVTDQVRVMAQFDVLDNTIMGSTSDNLAGLSRPFGDNLGAAPIPFLAGNQDPPEVGANGYTSSIRAKRAWAEIDTEFGSLRFGRMPWHFGRGMTYNDGSCLDCTGGTTVDRIAALTEVYGHQLMVALDFGPQGTTSQQLALGRDNPNGYPIDLAQDDDVFEYVAAITNIDKPIRLRERIDRGDVVFNYGAQLVYRSQQSSFSDDQCTSGANTNTGHCTVGATVPEQLPVLNQTYNQINAYMFQPSLWAKLYYRALSVEFEGTSVLGHMDHGGILLDPSEGSESVSFRPFGWVLASELRLYRDTLFVGLETGGASGDQAEDPSQYLNYRWRFVRQPAGDHSIRDYHFSPEYHVDSILFRQILGTVTNAVYVKPAIAYWFDLTRGRQLGLSGAAIYSMAQVPVSTPGNAIPLGLETDVGVNYRNSADGFYAGFTWGVLWPLAGLDRPEALPAWSATGVQHDAKAAQVLRGFLGVKF